MFPLYWTVSPGGGEERPSVSLPMDFLSDCPDLNLIKFGSWELTLLLKIKRLENQLTGWGCPSSARLLYNQLVSQYPTDNRLPPPPTSIYPISVYAHINMVFNSKRSPWFGVTSTVVLYSGFLLQARWPTFHGPKVAILGQTYVNTIFPSLTSIL